MDGLFTNRLPGKRPVYFGIGGIKSGHRDEQRMSPLLMVSEDRAQHGLPLRVLRGVRHHLPTNQRIEFKHLVREPLEVRQIASMLEIASVIRRRYLAHAGSTSIIVFPSCTTRVYSSDCTKICGVVSVLFLL
jgi:hypothetical protein